MNTANDYEPAEYTPIIGDIDNDIPGDNECLMGDMEDGILNDLDANPEDECLDSIWAV